MTMARTKIVDGTYLAQCEKCGAWVELRPETREADLFFEFLHSEFQCCGLTQSAPFILEKDSNDFH